MYACTLGARDNVGEHIIHKSHKPAAHSGRCFILISRRTPFFACAASTAMIILLPVHVLLQLHHCVLRHLGYVRRAYSRIHAFRSVSDLCENARRVRSTERIILSVSHWACIIICTCEALPHSSPSKEPLLLLFRAAADSFLLDGAAAVADSTRVILFIVRD
jgi:hypothetical protein